MWWIKCCWTESTQLSCVVVTVAHTNVKFLIGLNNGRQPFHLLKLVWVSVLSPLDCSGGLWSDFWTRPILAISDLCGALLLAPFGSLAPFGYPFGWSSGDNYYIWTFIVKLSFLMCNNCFSFFYFSLYFIFSSRSGFTVYTVVFFFPIQLSFLFYFFKKHFYPILCKQLDHDTVNERSYRIMCFTPQPQRSVADCLCCLLFSRVDWVATARCAESSWINRRCCAFTRHAGCSAADQNCWSHWTANRIWSQYGGF